MTGSKISAERKLELNYVAAGRALERQDIINLLKELNLKYTKSKPEHALHIGFVLSHLENQLDPIEYELEGTIYSTTVKSENFDD